ncbi:hypothetical protein GCM10011581_01490 [Saccharopolyspora subtropica]|uniref:Uncharacterized protein n=1 Tax=Saccharopolyspora thermophila TaxID=89367 RepID=A0A917JK07_9PSEU|nr:hypothetical protein [Saccharopolyspora subtropica]GGI68285.1 hypothetical protein GCM10011581_01490 [Saccharopolyspora subtropica]
MCQPRSRLGRVLYVGALGIGIAIALVAYFSFRAAQSTSFRAAQLTTGACVSITDVDTAEPGWERVGCGSPESDFVIASITSDAQPCPPPYAAVSQDTTGGVRLCLVPDVAVGDCLRVPVAGVQTKVPCTDPQANRTVTAVSTEAACPPGSEATAYPDPARTVCTAVR